ncbi:MAG: transcriptional regulator NrdR [Anaerolineae bacterium]|jgi:transcriptional repressor NrdR|nr:transcriptional repressor NrdR [Anaerolineales bacterium]MCQ3973349.1 transcriptional regulator NrdR [Anaerolineae bacterium]
MKCPFCNATSQHILVIDTREVTDGIRRRRKCEQCGQRFTTYERIAAMNMLVIKRDGRREEFDKEKLVKSMHVACSKRPVSSYAIDKAAQEIEAQLYALGKSEIDSLRIGEMVMDQLQDIDDVAYVRFASVYRRFQDIDSITEEIQHLQARRRREVELKNQIPLPIGGE